MRAIVRPFNVRALPRFIKSADKYILAERGRWGPRWFHRLIWHCARKCGMLRHHLMEDTVVSRIDLSDDPLLKAAQSQIFMFLEMNFNRDDLVILTGEDKWIDLLGSPDGWNIAIGELRGKFATTRRGYRQERILGVSVYIVPHMEGVIVLPRSVFR